VSVRRTSASLALASAMAVSTVALAPAAQATFEAVAGLGIDTVETVLLYHVVPGATIDAAAALESDDAELTTAQGGTVTVNVWSGPIISLGDQDTNARNPRVILSNTDINKGNKQIGHGIDRVLRPVDLPPLAH